MNTSARLLLMLILFFHVELQETKAQTYQSVTHLSGTALVGPVNNQTSVTVDTFGSVPTPPGLPGTCTWHYRIGASGLSSGFFTNGYSYVFNPPVSKIRIDNVQLDSAEVLTVYINGSKYFLSAGNLSNTTCTSLGTISPNIVNGTITTNVSIFVDAACKISLNPGYLIDSISVENSAWAAAGIGYFFEIALDTVVHVKKPFNDTLLCAGDSLYLNYVVGEKFNSSNTFTAQLSDASGSFTSPTTIGTITSNVTGIVPCKIPAGALGNGYRVRIVSSSPVRTSINNGKNIKISNIVPAGITASNNGPVCDGSSLTLNASSTTTGVSYSWTGPNSFTSMSQNPVINPAISAAGGLYRVEVSLNGCEASATTTVQIKPIPGIPVAGNNGPACTGGNITLNANSSTTGVTYNWSGPSGFTSSLQAPVLNNLTLSKAGVYSVTATLNGCTSNSANTTVVVNNGPKINIFPSPSNKVCIGDSITFLALVSDTNAGTTYQWMKNGVPVVGATTLKYKDGNFTNGDVISCNLIPGPGGTCSSAISSLLIPVAVLNYLAPSVSISVSPGDDVWQDLLVTFTATTADAGSNPKYQWKKNGQNVIGATGKDWSATNLNDDDIITCEITSNYECPQPKTALSNDIKMNIRLSVNDFEKNTSIRVYPNPVNDKLFVVNAIYAAYSITDITGRIIRNGNISPVVNSIDVSGITAGMYILHLQTGDNNNLRTKFNKR